jgi:hypothetical protein
MIENPSTATYLKISLAASLTLIVGIFGLLYFVEFPRRSTPVVVQPLPCDAESNPYTADWVTVPVGPSVTVKMPATLHPIGNDSTTWSLPGRTFEVRIEKTSRGAPRWATARGRVRTTPDHGTAGICTLPADGRTATVETSYFAHEGGEGYYEVFAEFDAQADSVVRVTVTANNAPAQRVGLTIVRSLRFATAPPPT